MRRLRLRTHPGHFILASLFILHARAPLAEAQRPVPSVTSSWRQGVVSPTSQSQTSEDLTALVRTGWVQPVRFEAPAGAVIEIASNSGSVQLQIPAKVGLELGRVYRLRITEVPGKPGIAFYPTLRLIGYLVPPAHVNPLAYPIPVQFLEQDFQEASTGRLVNDVVFLEDPLTALPVSYPPGELPVLDTRPGEDVLLRASKLGRPMVLLQLGNRIPLDDQLASSAEDPTVHMVPEVDAHSGSVEGNLSILAAGWQSSGGYPRHGNAECACRGSAPACSSNAPIVRLPYKVHPRMPQDECLPDGGDAIPYAHLDGYGQIAGLGPSETVARFSRPGEGPRVAVSNQVCLYAPRFGLVRSSSASVLGVHLDGPRGVDHGIRRAAFESREGAATRRQQDQTRLVRRRELSTTVAMREPLGSIDELRVIAAMRKHEGIDKMDGRTGPNVMGQADEARIAASIEAARVWSRTEYPAYTALTEGGAQISGTMHTGEIQQVKNPNLSPGELVLWKTVTPNNARQGDTVEFAIYYKNVGQKPIEDVSIIDSLTGRLEYVANSAKTDRRAVFTGSPNDVGSQELRWDISDPIEGGKGGVVWFQAKVR